MNFVIGLLVEFNILQTVESGRWTKIWRARLVGMLQVNRLNPMW